MQSHLNELIPHSRHVELVELFGIWVFERAESQRQLGSVEDRRVTLFDSLLKLVKNAIVAASVEAHPFEKPHLRCEKRQDAKRIDLLAWRLWKRAQNVDNNSKHRKTLHHCREAESQLAENLECKSPSSKCCWIKNLAATYTGWGRKMRPGFLLKAVRYKKGENTRRRAANTDEIKPELHFLP